MRKNTFPLIMLFILGLFLTACTIEIRTTLDNSGAGRIDISISNGEQDPTTIFSNVGMTAIELCSQDAWGDRIETDATFVLDESDDTTSCLISIPFESIAKLEGIYTGMDLTVNELSLDEGTIVYDITVDSETEAEDLAVLFQNETGVDWQVALPGEIQLDHTPIALLECATAMVIW